MSVKKFLKAYLQFGSRDRTGITALVVLILVVYFLPVWFPAPPPAPPKAWETAVVEQEEIHPEQKAYKTFTAAKEDPSENEVAGELFRFDPNTLSEEGWQRLGLKEKTARTIIKYRSKGGHFYRPEDLQRIWGLPHGFYERVQGYIDLPQQAFARQKESVAVPQEKPKPRYRMVSVNDADTAAFIALPGIGSKLAQRITGFRDRLGGFHSVDQVRETFGLADSTFQKIRPLLQLGGSHKKIGINTATKETLKAHPYIRWAFANAVVEYRNQHGAFTSLDQLKNITLISDSAFRKMLPYLDLD